MKQLSLKLREEIFQDVETVIHKMHIPRNAYINQALDFYNKLQRRRMLKKQLHKESLMVRDRSLEVLHEFERLGDPIPE